MKNISTLFTLVMVFVALLLLGSSAFATYYQYTDDSGSVVMTNKKSAVPAKFRATMKMVKEDPQTKAAAKAPVPQHDPAEESVAQTQAQAALPDAVPEGRFAQLCGEFPWLKPVVYLVAFVAAFLLVVKLTSLLPSPHMAKAIYLLFFVGVGVFIYKSYVDHVAQSFIDVKKDAARIVEKTNQRPDAGRDLIKDMPDAPANPAGNR